MNSARKTDSFFDITRICRCCLTQEVELKPVFSHIVNIPEIVFLFTAVKLTKNDGLPENICTHCLDQLNNFVEFKRKVENSTVVLGRYLTRNSLEENATEIISSSPNLTCEVCMRSYASKSAYNRHIKLHRSSNNTFRCDECGKRFKLKSVFEAHKICHNKQQMSPTRTPYKCQICNSIFAVEQDLLIHNSMHRDGNKCNVCDKQFENIAKLKRHIPQHFKEKPFKCHQCEMGFTEMSSLTRHFRKHTTIQQISTHVCLVCGKVCPSRYTLNVHTRNHTGERPWTCLDCNKRFTDFRLLNSHKKIHKEGKPHQCDQCNKRFRHKSSLITHHRAHTSDRPYRCDKCKKSYKQSWCLLIHKRTHVLAKQFFCGQCHQLFTTTAALTDHLQFHTDQVISDDHDPKEKEPPEYFQCKVCAAQLPSRLDLITHEKLTHALSHECDLCFGKWTTLEELLQHKCDEAMQTFNESTPDEMILLPNGEIQDCNTVVNALLASISQGNPRTE